MRGWYSKSQIDYDDYHNNDHDDVKMREDILIEHVCDSVLHEDGSRKVTFS